MGNAFPVVPTMHQCKSDSVLYYWIYIYIYYICIYIYIYIYIYICITNARLRHFF